MHRAAFTYNNHTILGLFSLNGSCQLSLDTKLNQRFNQINSSTLQ